MTTRSRSNWEHGNVDFTATTRSYFIAKVHGGESIWIKGKFGNTGYVYIGSGQDVTSITGYELEQGEGIEIKHDMSFGVNSYIEVWGIAATAGDDVTFFKVIQDKVVPVRIGKPEKADLVR